jgi:hypothetical protein
MRLPFLFLFVTFAACSPSQLEPDAPDPVDPDPQVVIVGADGFTVRLVSVLEDTRCPSDVYCIWSGSVKLLLEGTLKTGSSARFILNWPSQPQLNLLPFADVLGYRVTFVELQPSAPARGVGIPQDKYRVKVQVTPIPQP